MREIIFRRRRRHRHRTCLAKSQASMVVASHALLDIDPHCQCVRFPRDLGKKGDEWGRAAKLRDKTNRSSTVSSVEPPARL